MARASLTNRSTYHVATLGILGVAGKLEEASRAPGFDRHRDRPASREVTAAPRSWKPRSVPRSRRASGGGSSGTPTVWLHGCHQEPHPGGSHGSVCRTFRAGVLGPGGDQCPGPHTAGSELARPAYPAWQVEPGHHPPGAQGPSTPDPDPSLGGVLQGLGVAWPRCADLPPPPKRSRRLSQVSPIPQTLQAYDPVDRAPGDPPLPVPPPAQLHFPESHPLTPGSPTPDLAFRGDT